MTAEDEIEMHEWAVKLAQFTEGTGWEAMRYLAIARLLLKLTEFCAICDCTAKRNQQGKS
jgi:hypothetical protein